MSNLSYVLTELEKYLNFRKNKIIEQKSLYNPQELDLEKQLETFSVVPLNGFRTSFTDFVKNPNGKRVSLGEKAITSVQVRQVISLLKNPDLVSENLKLQLSVVNNLIEEIVKIASEFLISQIDEKPNEQKITEIKDNFKKDILEGLCFDSCAEKEIRRGFDIN